MNQIRQALTGSAREFFFMAKADRRAVAAACKKYAEEYPPVPGIAAFNDDFRDGLKGLFS